jgi:hypothetical protein
MLHYYWPTRPYIAIGKLFLVFFYQQVADRTGEEAYVVLIGFRFAPKLHGILTKAQAVLQLFLLAGLYQLGSVHARYLFLWANLCWSFIARKEIRKCWSNVLQVKFTIFHAIKALQQLVFYLILVSHLKLLANKALHKVKRLILLTKC